MIDISEMQQKTCNIKYNFKVKIKFDVQNNINKPSFCLGAAMTVMQTTNFETLFETLV